MAQIIRLRRSSVSGQKPTNSNLQLGEIALNTTDGKAFMAVSGSGGPSVQEFILTNTVNTGSIHLTGDISGSLFTGSFKGDGSQLYNIPLSGVTNLTTISGSFDTRLDGLEAYSASQIVPTSSYSERTTQIDVYVKNVSGVQINKGKVVRISNSVGDTPIISLADWTNDANSANTLGVTAQNIPHDGFGNVVVNGILIGVNTSGMTAGALLYLSASGDYTTNVPTFPYHTVRLGEVLRPHQTVGSFYVSIDNGYELGELHDMKFSTLTDGDLLMKSGSNDGWVNTKDLRGNYNITGSLVITENLTVYGSSSISYVTSSQLQVATSFISVNVFEPAERFGGLKVYDSGSQSHLATASLAWDSLNNRWVYQNASGSSYSGAMLLSGPRNSGSMGEEVALTSGRIPKSVGGDHLDNSNIRDTGTIVSVNSNTQITGSLLVSSTIVSEVISLVSGSAQITISDTTGYSTFSSSIAATDLAQNNRLNSIEGVTGSYATTGSNVFKATQTIDGNLFMSGTNRLIYNNDATNNMLFGQFDGSNIYGPYYQLFGNQYSNLSQRGSAEFVFDTRNGGESGFNIASFNGTTWTRKFRVDDSGALITGSLNVTQAITGSVISGAFIGDGAQLYNIPASGVTGLQLNQIVDGAATASISNTDGFRVNKDTIITGSLNVTQNITGSLISGAFKGDGAQLYNIPASGVTGLQLNQIVSGSVSASISPDNGFRINTNTNIGGDLVVVGTLTAKEIHTSVVTSSVLYESGSTRFGDTLDDTHDFTGSVRITGSLSVDGSSYIKSSQLTNQNLVNISSGAQTILTNQTGSYTSAFYNYTISSGSNARAGQLMCVWNGTTIKFTDNSTTDIGNTSGVALTASLSGTNVILTTVLPTNGWTIKSLINLL